MTGMVEDGDIAEVCVVTVMTVLLLTAVINYKLNLPRFLIQHPRALRGSHDEVRVTDVTDSPGQVT